jgi:glycosyltransferase involved in cell wall biosynthesis
MQTARLIYWLKNSLRTILGPVLPLVRALRTLPARQNARQSAARLQTTTGIAVCYLTSQFPTRPALRTEYSFGGAVKLTFLAESFPHSYPQASLLYTVSSVNHVAKSAIVRTARNNGVKIVLNQNGVAYLAWHGPGWEPLNRKMRDVFEQADYIIFQSKFCELCALKFLGSTSAPSQIIYNPVDINLYQPAKKSTGRTGPVLLLGGNQYEKYRFESAIEVLRQTLTLLPDARLIITGKLWGDNQQVSMALAQKYLRKYAGIEEHVEFTGTYSQAAAQQIFQRADILIHTKFNDPSPNLIPETMASGLPVVYSATGGVPELVGADAGIGVPVEQNWDKINLPDPNQMAHAILTIWEDLPVFADAARQRAIEQFPLEKFIHTHRELFTRLLD